MRTFIRLLAAGFFAASVTAQASTFSSEITDMWWIPTESGWGVNVILQNNVAFMTFFIYNQALSPVWYTAQLSAPSGVVWTGPLYATTGPAFSTIPFDPSLVTRTQVGTATFQLVDLNSATLTYSVNGVVVVKNLVRQTWTNENYTGTYIGGYSLRFSNCQAGGGGIAEISGLLNISQTGNNMTMDLSAGGATCNYAGNYSQTGKLGAVQGNYTCSDGTIGSFLIYEMTPTISGFTARATGQTQTCQWSGYFSGMARAQ